MMDLLVNLVSKLDVRCCLGHRDLLVVCPVSLSFCDDSNRGSMSATAILEPQSRDPMLKTSAWSGATPPPTLVRARLTGEVQPAYSIFCPDKADKYKLVPSS